MFSNVASVPFVVCYRGRCGRQNKPCRSTSAPAVAKNKTYATRPSLLQWVLVLYIWSLFDSSVSSRTVL